MKKHTIDQYLQAMKAHDLLSGDDTLAIGSQIVERVAYHNKYVEADTMFVCKGAAFKEEYLDQAIASGAIVYISEQDYQKTIPCIRVNHVQKTLALVANLYYEYPWKALSLIGITGTKGKSTTAYYVKYILDEYLRERHGIDTAILSSIDTYDGKSKKESLLTTPESLELQQHFHNAQESGLTHLVMEVSSQALKCNRVYDTRFNMGVFLNIGDDHISSIEHPDLDDYLASKLKIFSQSDVACVNMDSDHLGKVLSAAQKAKQVITFGTRDEADVFGYDIRKEELNTIFRVRTERFDEEFTLTMPGLFNVENALAAISVAYVLDIPYVYMSRGLLKARASGRMEIYTNRDRSIISIVDYAHNKLSFEKLYESTKAEYPDREIITVFGCPGGHAYQRRRDLGLASGQNSDRIYLTAEDPGVEDVMDICKEIAGYIEQVNGKYEIVEDRPEAIRKAILEANPNSVILITGKGNETRQKVGKQHLPYATDTDYAIMYLNEYDERRG